MKEKTKILVFDMDGTIADLYGVNDWLEKLLAEDVSPFQEARPLTNMTLLIGLLNKLKRKGYKVVVTTWLPKNAKVRYNKQVRKAKISWLQKYSFPYDEIHIVKYGTTKANCTRRYGKNQTLFDDNEKIRSKWSLGNAVEPEKMIEYLTEQIFSQLVK